MRRLQEGDDYEETSVEDGTEEQSSDEYGSNDETYID